MSTADGASAAVRVLGDRPVTVDRAATVRDRFGWETRECTIRCHSGQATAGRWAGVPLAPLLEAAVPPPDTTHVVVSARDGYRVPVPVGLALEALLGLVRESVQVTGEARDDHVDGTPRLLGPGLDSTRAVREVETIEPVSVPPGADPLDVGTDD